MKQINLHSVPTGGSLEIEDEGIDTDGRFLIIPLDMEELRNLKHLSDEAWLLSQGLERVTVMAAVLEPGDIIPPLGVTVRETPLFTDSGLSHVRVQFETAGSLVLRGNHELIVHRRVV